MTKRRMSLRRNQTNLKTERHEGRRCVHSAGDGRHGKPRSFTDSWDLRLDMEQQSVVMVNKGMVYAWFFLIKTHTLKVLGRKEVGCVFLQDPLILSVCVCLKNWRIQTLPMLCSNILKGIRYTVVDIDAEDVLIPLPLVFDI